MKFDDPLYKKERPYTAHLGFRDDPKLKDEILRLEMENGYNRSELLRKFVRMGLSEFKKTILKTT